MNLNSYKNAKNELISGNYSVGDYFKQNNFVLEYGYARLFSGDPKGALIEFEKIKDIDFRANWAVKLVQMILYKRIEAPSYFQLRNFLEIDLNLLLQAGQSEFIETLLSRADWLYSINPESYKFIARVMLNNDFDDVAIFYLLKAKGKFYQDPEMHLMLAMCYINKGEKGFAKASVRNCLNILPDYLPAKKLLLSLD